MDREVWLMLLGYLLDARSTSAIAKSVSGFAQLRHVHESAVMCRIVIMVNMHDEKLVPPSVTVGVGDGVKIRTWTVPVYIMSATSVTTLGDEDGYCQGNLPWVSRATGYSPKNLDTIDSLQWQMAGEPNTLYQEMTPPLQAEEMGPPA
jgi:hypothetical protein